MIINKLQMKNFLLLKYTCVPLHTDSGQNRKRQTQGRKTTQGRKKNG